MDVETNDGSGIENSMIVNEDDSNVLKMMQISERNYNKIRKNNKQQLSNHSKNHRQSEVTQKIQNLYDEVDAEFNNFKSNMLSP